MKKRIISAILTGCMLLSCAATAGSSVSATTESSQSTEYHLADSVNDGVILQAWNWSYKNVEKHLEKLASLGYTTIQVSPPSVIKQPTKDVKVYYGPTGKTGWWMFYQPADFSLNTKEDNALGTKDELISLTTKAHELGMKIIADGVINHLGTKEGDPDVDPNYVAKNDYSVDTKNRVTSAVEGRALRIMEANAFHPYFNTMYLENTWDVDKFFGNGVKVPFPNYPAYQDATYTAEYHSAFDQTQGSISNLPDLDTSNPVVQEVILEYFKECIDAGIDGFRFDAAKHIETPEDPEGIASDFWDVVIGGANKYAKETRGIDMFYYGEILNSCGIDRPFERYLKYMEITDSSTYYGQFDAANGNASRYGNTYSNGMNASNAITWAESHDIYMDYFNHNQTIPSENTINKRWALAAARDNTAMYFARPADVYTTVLGDADETAWANKEVGAINHFHTEMSGESECISKSGNFAINERGTTGVVVVNCTGTNAKIDGMKMKQLESGTYYDHITGNKFECRNGKLYGDMGNTGIVVLYAENQPKVGTTTASCSYISDTMDVVASAKNVQNSTYTINGSEEVAYNNGDTITIGKADDANGTTYQLRLYGYNNGKLVACNTYTYTKQAPHITLNLNGTNWSSVNVYLWKDADKSSNAAWPGVAMTKLSDGVYGCTVSGDYDRVIFNSGSAQTADLIYSGPADYTLTNNGGDATSTPNGVTDVDPFYPDGFVPTDAPEVLVWIDDENNAYRRGDANKDNKITISDVTSVQRSLLKLYNFNGNQLKLCDYDKNGKVSIKDATAIQYFLLQ